MDIKQALINLSSSKLKKATVIKERIEALHAELESLLLEVTPTPIGIVVKKRKTMSAAARKKIAEAGKARWARIRAAKAKV
jgi:hypothetical protein